ncbi:MAG: hypothetical protein HKN87_14535 [Saprospiraceae bacterium]|nr:hypothetical protein [Saprospiraceae bacterium]
MWVILTVALYWGFDTKSIGQKKELASRALSGTQVDVGPIINTAKESLAVQDLQEINALEGVVEGGAKDTLRVNYLKQLSGKWYKLQEFLIAGHYATLVAETEPTGEHWSIAGTTYIPGIANQDPILSKACFQGAVSALENAISLDPEQINHRVNLALAYTERPPEDNPMKGIQMLLNLDKKHPDELVVLTTLGRLAMKTGQMDRAKERLERAVELDPNYVRAVCLLAELYRQTSDLRADELAEKCELINN